MSGELAYGRHYGPTPPDARRAAVIALLFHRNGEWIVPLTRRSDKLASHAGQISLPGGSIEMNESAEQASLREAEEELGIDARQIEPLGTLSPLYVFATGFLVHPFVGYLAGEPACPAKQCVHAATLAPVVTPFVSLLLGHA